MIRPENTCFQNLTEKTETFAWAGRNRSVERTRGGDWWGAAAPWSTCTVTLMKFNILCYRLLLLLPCQHWISFMLMWYYLCVEVPHGADRLHWPSIISIWLHLLLYIFIHLIQTSVFILKSHYFWIRVETIGRFEDGRNRMWYEVFESFHCFRPNDWFLQNKSILWSTPVK